MKKSSLNQRERTYKSNLLVYIGDAKCKCGNIFIYICVPRNFLLRLMQNGKSFIHISSGKKVLTNL